jgi:pyruvate dehydrogenase E2 component (dihydrolipoamide acetyltransferase)
MARLEFKLPDIGEGVTEGEIVNWFVAAGDQLAEDDPMVEIMTDKATVIIGAPCDARVEALLFEVGAVARVGQVILTLESEGASNIDSAMRSSRPPATAVGELKDELPGARMFADRIEVTSKEDAYFDAKPLAAPATRQLAKQLGVDVRRVRPTGSGGRVTADDLRAAIGDSAPDGQPNAALEERTPIVGMRRTIAERMHRAITTAAHFTFVEECDATRLVELREQLLPEAQRKGIRLTFLPFIIRAVTDALRKHPVLNSAIDERTNELVCKRYYNIGVATATDAGLMVPVVRDADRLGLFELAATIRALRDAARARTLAPENLRDSTFTVTSLGKQSGLLATPILNHPEVGILGVHRIKQKPVVRDGEIVVGQLMLLSLSLDHRVVDGHVGAAFAYDVIASLEAPEQLFDGQLR